jgi:hypothetical protein
MSLLDQLIADAKFTDDTKFKIGDQEVSMAELRAFQRANSESKAAFEKRQREAEEEYQKAQRLGADALALYESVKGDGGKKAAEGNDTGDEIDWSAPGMKALKTKLEAYDKAVSEWQTKSKQLEAAIASGFSFVTDYVWNQGYSSLDELSRPKDKALPELVKYAQEQKITDRWGLPDPIKAARMLTEADRQAAIEKKAREEGRREGERAARAAAAGTRPGALEVRPRIPEKGEKPKNMRDLIAKAAADPEIQRIAGGGEN